MEGKVKFFNNSKGFGFVVADDGTDYFVHITGLAEGVTIRDHDRVVFDIEQGQRGPKAVNVRLAEGGAGADTAAQEQQEDTGEAQEEEPAAEESEPETQEEPEQEDETADDDAEREEPAAE